MAERDGPPPGAVRGAAGSSRRGRGGRSRSGAPPRAGTARGSRRARQRRAARLFRSSNAGSRSQRPSRSADGTGPESSASSPPNSRTAESTTATLPASQRSSDHCWRPTAADSTSLELHERADLHWREFSSTARAADGECPARRLRRGPRTPADRRSPGGLSPIVDGHRTSPRVGGLASCTQELPWTSTTCGSAEPPS
jgi:hypothetical protein